MCGIRSNVYTYSRVGLAHSLEESEMESGDSWGSNLLLVLVEPQVVGSVGSQIVLLSVKVIVVHFFDFIL